MTDFGRRTGDMEKSTYDADEDATVDNAELLQGQTVAQVQDHTPKTHTHVEADVTDLDHDAQKIKGVAVNDSELADSKILAYESASEELAYVDMPAGPPTDYLKMSGEGILHVRASALYIQDGTDASTLKCRLYDIANGDTTDWVDNIPKDGASGGFALDSTGKVLTVDHSILSGNVLLAFPSMRLRGSTTLLSPNPIINGGDIGLQFWEDETGDREDITAAVDNGNLWVNLLYITDA